MSHKVVMLATGSGTADPRIAKEATALSRAGCDVVVLGWDRSGGSPGSHAHEEGWVIESLGPPARHGAGWRNIPGYVAFWREAARRTRELAPDALHCHNLDSVPAALSVLRTTDTQPKLILDFWEIYRHSRALPQRGLAGAIARTAAQYLERRSIPRADLVITVVDGQVYYYDERGARNVIVVQNAPDPDRYQVVDRSESEFVVSFIGQKRWVPSLISLMRAIQPHSDMHALLVGGGPAEAEVASIAATMERIETAGRVSPGEIPALYQRSDAVYACYDTSLLNWRTALPVKAMEGMACGLPVIVTKGTWMAEYVEQHGVGLSVDDTDPSDVERALMALSEDRQAAREMGRRGRTLIERDLNWPAAATRLVNAYRALGMCPADSLD